MKKTLVLFSLIAVLASSFITVNYTDVGKFDGKNKETYKEYLDRKNSITDNVTGKFGTSSGANQNTLTFSQAHIECTNQEKIFETSSSCTGTDNCTSGSSGGDMKVDRYNACMATYAPFLDEQEGVNSCGAETIEWGEYGTGQTCFAELAEVAEFKDTNNNATNISEGSSVLVQNQNLTDSFQGFAKVVCEAGLIKILDSKCTLVPDPCEAGDILGDPDKLPSRYKDNENWQSSHLWPVTEPTWARPNSDPYFVSGDPKNVDRSAEFDNKVNAGQREDYCYATLDQSNAGSLNTDFPVKSGDLIVNPELDNTDAFFDKENSNGIFRCFDGEFYNEGSSCQYVEQSCDSAQISVPNGKGQFCEFNLPNQKHNATFTNRNPLPENSLGHVKAFCWDGQWEIWEESCNLSCENSLSGESWNSEDGDPQNCTHQAKVFTGRTTPTAVLTVNNENKLMDGSKSYKCDNGEWVDQSQSCMPKSCTNLSSNNWSDASDPNASCSHKALGYSTPHNKIISTSANNGSNATVGYISYQCRYGQFSDITDYTGLPEFAPTTAGFSPSDKNCTSTIYPPQCYFDLAQTEPSDDPSIFIDQGNGCYIECRVNNLTGELNCTKSCTNTGSTNPDKDCFFPGGYTACESKGWYDLGTEIHCPNWKLTPQVCNSGAWTTKNIPSKNWSSKIVTSFSESLSKDGFLDNNVKPKVKVDFGLVYNIFNGQNQYGFGNSAGSPVLDKGVTSGSGAAACNSQAANIYGETDTSDYCFVKAEQSNVKDWKVFYDGGEGCALSGAQSGEWTTTNVSVECTSSQAALPATADATFVIRYTDGLTLTSPKIAINASIKAPVVPAGYCPSISPVANITSGAGGAGCENTITIANNIQANTPTQSVNELRYSYKSGVCYEVEYTGSLLCEDSDPTPNHETLGLVGSLSCVSNPVAAFNCGVSEVPKWNTEVSQIQVAPLKFGTLTIPAVGNSGLAFTVTGNYIETLNGNNTGCDVYSRSCNAELAVVSGNEIASWSIVSMPNVSDHCVFTNDNNTVNMTSGFWYTEGAKLVCGFEDPDYTRVVLEFKLKDGTIVRTKHIEFASTSFK
jgi:hypothetical protein